MIKMKGIKLITIVNILLVLAMLIHVSVKFYLHEQHPEFSSPSTVELVNAIYYLIPLIIINIGNYIFKNR